MRLKNAVLVRGGLFVAAIVMVIAGSMTALAQSGWLVHSFAQSGIEGNSPIGKLVTDSMGNLYGTTRYGGSTGLGGGVIYELVKPVPPNTAWTNTVLYRFTTGAGGITPVGGLVFDKSGNLYGMTAGGGHDGVVYELVAPSLPGGSWTEVALYSFGSFSGDGSTPVGELVWDSAGNLYGVTQSGGAAQGSGTIFQLSPPATAGGTWTEAILHSFSLRQGDKPQSGLVIDAGGNLYGTTPEGGLVGGNMQDGVVYRLSPPVTAGGAWRYRILHEFPVPVLGNPEGSVPMAGVTLHGNGVLYGTTTYGGVNGYGTVFQLVPPAVAGGAWTESTLYPFASPSDGTNPVTDVVFDSAGNLYGTTATGGAFVAGTVFQLSPPASSGGAWTHTILHSLNAAKDGAGPSGGLIFGKNGVLFGPTRGGGVHGGVGTVYGVLK